MNEKTIILNSNKVLTKKFIPHGKGYDPDEVDAFLDVVVQDYVVFENYAKESKDYIIKLETALKNEKEHSRALEIENAKYAARFEGVKNNNNVNLSNIDYINRIDKLEKALYAQGINPNNIK
ncbi:MAG: DivIVA domain-containing protein [Bacilli bacterium]|nr:DivIVA domain-containing protein [Bacilli bacterium]